MVKNGKIFRGKRKALEEDIVSSPKDDDNEILDLKPFSNSNRETFCKVIEIQDDPSDDDLLVQLKPGSKKSNDSKKVKLNVQNNIPIDGEPDGLGGLDQGATYVVEYSKTSRATCKRCDIRLKKKELRVGHRPLFRGKPGYQVFKHLQ